MRTHNIPSCYRKSKRFLLCLLTWRFPQPSLARTTPVSELIFMVLKVFEPLKFDCIYALYNSESYSRFPVFKFSKGNNSVKIFEELWSLFSAYCLMMLYICIKFHENN